MNRFLYTLALAALALPLAAQDKPNIILMMADDMGYGDLGANGGKIIREKRLPPPSVAADELPAAGVAPDVDDAAED